VHAFIVPLRDEAGRCLPGVEIHDCGYKVSVIVTNCLSGIPNSSSLQSAYYVKAPQP
jgi:hypothetical protein